ncbi:MAG: porin [Elusimicrobia bacterium]|nr:porin [Elusimicrobiota bacterium]
MKKLVGIITVLALFTSVASAELLKNFKANGSIEVLSITADNAVFFNKDTNDKYSETEARVVVGATFDLNDDVDAKITAIKTDQQYGSGTTQDANDILSAFEFYEAYINLKGVLGMDHRIGKQFYGTPGDMVIYYGPSAWYARYLGASNMEGWTANYKKDKLTVGAITGKALESTNNTMNDIDLYGVTASYDLYEYLNPGFYYYQKDDRSTFLSPIRLSVMGVKANGKVAGFNYAAEYAMNGGSDHGLTTDMNYRGTLMHLNADYGLEVGFGKFVFMGKYVMGSGDKTTGNKDDKQFRPINPNYRPGLILGGTGTGAFTTITSPSNLTTMTYGANFTPNKWDGKLNLDAKMVMAKYTEATLDGLGNEIDFVTTWNHSDDVTLKLALARFSPDKDIAILAKKDAVNLVNFYANVKF